MITMKSRKNKSKTRKKYKQYPEKLGFIFDISPDLTEQNLSICLARDSEKERIIYSFSQGLNIYELNLALGTVKKTLQELKEFAIREQIFFA